MCLFANMKGFLDILFSNTISALQHVLQMSPVTLQNQRQPDVREVPGGAVDHIHGDSPHSTV